MPADPAQVLLEKARDEAFEFARHTIAAADFS